MTQLTSIEKIAIVTILSQIMNADGVIHPNEEDYMNKVYAELGIMISDMEDITNMDEIQAKSIINAMLDEKKKYALSFFVLMAKSDGFVHPSESAIIEQLYGKDKNNA